jgi:DNA-directed RNA polymerase subunit RPC12/RpoP
MAPPSDPLVLCPLKCHHCGHEFSTYVDWVEATPEIACPACRVVTRYDGQDLRRIMDDVERALARLRGTLRQG